MLELHLLQFVHVDVLSSFMSSGWYCYGTMMKESMGTENIPQTVHSLRYL
jgi:hypothetical protein